MVKVFDGNWIRVSIWSNHTERLYQGAFSRTSADINLGGGGGGESVSEVLKSTRKVEIDGLVHISLFRSYNVACLGTRDVAVYSYH